MIIFGDVRDARKIARAAGCGFDPDIDHVVSRIRPDGELLGGVIYTSYTGRSVQMHMAGFYPRWATSQFMWAIYDFPFNCMKVERVIGTVPSTNKRALDIDDRMGFVHVATIPDVVPGGDMEILSMSRADCKYLKLGERFAPAPTMENAA